MLTVPMLALEEQGRGWLHATCDMSEEEIFHQAMARRDPMERAAYLDQACGGDAALRASVEALLRADVGATGFMDRPPPDPDATVDPPTGERPETVIG